MDATSAHDPHAPSVTLVRLISTKGRFLTVVAAYFILRFVARIITSPTVDLDEGEQLLASRQLALGYGPQPPLYTWFNLQYVSAPMLHYPSKEARLGFFIRETKAA